MEGMKILVKNFEVSIIFKEREWVGNLKERYYQKQKIINYGRYDINILKFLIVSLKNLKPYP